jgi:hypothetical protein
LESFLDVPDRFTVADDQEGGLGQLARMMIDHNVGVTPVQAYEVKRIDTDYFTEERGIKWHLK